MGGRAWRWGGGERVRGGCNGCEGGRREGRGGLMHRKGGRWVVDEESATRLMSCGEEMVCFVRVWDNDDQMGSFKTHRGGQSRSGETESALPSTLKLCKLRLGIEMTANGNTPKKKTLLIYYKKNFYGCMRRYSVRFEKGIFRKSVMETPFHIYSSHGIQQSHMTQRRVT